MILRPHRSSRVEKAHSHPYHKKNSIHVAHSWGFYNLSLTVNLSKLKGLLFGNFQDGRHSPYERAIGQFSHTDP